MLCVLMLDWITLCGLIWCWIDGMMTDSVFFSVIECCFGCICVCLPSLRCVFSQDKNENNLVSDASYLLGFASTKLVCVCAVCSVLDTGMCEFVCISLEFVCTRKLK